MIETFEEMPKVKANGLNVLVLASVGDAAYTLAVREKLSFFDLKAGELSKRAAEKVCARAQAEKADRLSEVFSEEEEECLVTVCLFFARKSKPLTIGAFRDLASFFLRKG